MNTPNPLTHRLWLIAWCGRTGRMCSEELLNIFQNRMTLMVGKYEREEALDPGTLEALRLREWAKLMREASG